MNRITGFFLLTLFATPLWADDPIPGIPGVDYPNYTQVPETSFDCKQQPSFGYFGDPESGYQAFYICQADGRTDAGLCPLGTVFDQQYFVCDWWYNVKARKEGKITGP
jgi:hypothetical protein